MKDYTGVRGFGANFEPKFCLYRQRQNVYSFVDVSPTL